MAPTEIVPDEPIDRVWLVVGSIDGLVDGFSDDGTLAVETLEGILEPRNGNESLLRTIASLGDRLKER